MKKEMLINAAQTEECRIAILEDGVLEELYVERANQETYVGNIYKGKIVNIEPSIQAAFVDFGGGRNGFLHVSDVDPAYFKHLLPKDVAARLEAEQDEEYGVDRPADRGPPRERSRDRGERGPRREREPRRTREEAPPAEEPRELTSWLEPQADPIPAPVPVSRPAILPKPPKPAPAPINLDEDNGFGLGLVEELPPPVPEVDIPPPLPPEARVAPAVIIPAQSPRVVPPPAPSKVPDDEEEGSFGMGLLDDFPVEVSEVVEEPVIELEVVTEANAADVEKPRARSRTRTKKADETPAAEGDEPKKPRVRR